ncbi:DNA polymerase IV [Gordonia sp. TBRC 11910]|uniref:DNA-directed DNA polymerase n=1 Tax=Gordonia asplenii TaxID=2725283 RepID=A0A848L2I6_9ACTN|nr:DNA polymerase IV [Gordonia asplenii]NMO04642.1 DNA polymerase IV [Gordonia asplenii]
MTTAQRFGAILHVDLDQFQVSVERLRSPELVDVPVIVGGNGDPTEARKVVTCASYEARAQGVRAGMPLRVAHRKMPDAVYLPLDAPAYDVASADVMATLRSFGHPVEVWGWDEAYLGADVDDPAALASQIITAIADRNGLRASIGISDNKQRAKMATNFAKKQEVRDAASQRIFRLDAGNWIELMGEGPTKELWSVGPKTAKKLSANGVDTVNQLIATPKDDLIATFGPHQGNWLYVLSRGGGDATITAEPWLARSHSKSRTYATDITDAAELHAAIAELTREVLDQVLAEQRVVFRIAITVRTKTFYTRTKSRKLPEPTIALDDIEPVCHALLDQFELDRPVRLLGVRLDLVTDDEESR